MSPDAMGTLAPVPGSPFGGRLDGPAWDGHALLFCRVDANEILRFDPLTDQAEQFRHSTSATRGLAFGPDGRLFGAQSRSRRVVWYEEGGATYYLNAMLDGQRHNDPQDLVVDRLGRIWFSDDWTQDSIAGPVGWPPLEHRSVLRLRRIAETDDRIGDWALERMTGDTNAPCGVSLSPDQETLYVTDLGDGSTIPATLRAYPVTEAGLGSASILHEFGVVVGDPDLGPHGLCVAGDGRLFVAFGGIPDGRGPAIEVFSPDGRLAERHQLPSGAPTNCTFGGPQHLTLYVTTSDGHVLRMVDQNGGDR